MGWGTVLMIACGGALAIEGAAWAIAPRAMRESYAEIFAMGDTILHRVGLVSVMIGCVMIFGAVKAAGG